MPMPKRRTYLLGVAVTATAACLAWAVVAVPAAVAGGAGTAWSSGSAGPDPVVTAPSPADTADPSVTAPSPSDTADPPVEACPAPSPTGAVAVVPAALQAGRAPAIVGPFTCDDGDSVIVVSWDDDNVKIAIDAARMKKRNCVFDPASVRVNEQPNGAVVDAAGKVRVPFDATRTKKLKITITYSFDCLIDGVRKNEDHTLDVEFTPPSGPIVIEPR
jgi:hypothetical protein